MTFNYNISEKENGIILALSGQLIDKSQSAEMSERIAEMLEHGTNRIVVNMEDLKYINSSGLNVLINLLTRARKSGGDVVITNLSPKVKQLFLITKLNAVFHVEDNMEQALARMEGN